MRRSRVISRGSSLSRQRGAIAIATGSLWDVFASPLARFSSPLVLSASDLPDVDGRRWSPARVTVAAAVPRSAARAVVRPSKRAAWWPSAGLAFADPSGVVACARRAERRRVMIAKGGPGSRVRRRRGPFSDFSC